MLALPQDRQPHALRGSTLSFLSSMDCMEGRIGAGTGGGGARAARRLRHLGSAAALDKDIAKRLLKEADCPPRVS